MSQLTSENRGLIREISGGPTHLRPSRRWLMTSMVLMGARGLPLRLFAQKSQSDIPYSESQRLIASVLSLERNLTAQSPAVQEWLANSEIVRRTKATGL